MASGDAWHVENAEEIQNIKRSKTKTKTVGQEIKLTRVIPSQNIKSVKKRVLNANKEPLTNRVLQKFKEGSGGNKLAQAFRGMVVKKMVEREEYDIKFKFGRFI